MLDSDEELTLSDTDEVFFPGSDDELGFEEVEIGDGSGDESAQEGEQEFGDGSGDESAQEGEKDNTR